jgi:hypothetical protein
MNTITWQKVYDLADELFRVAPWDFIEETDLFAVKTSRTRQLYFISVMGSGGQLNAISAYQGAAALEGFWDLQQGTNKPPEFILTLPHMMLAYEVKSNLTKDLLKHFASLGRNYGSTAQWPEVKQIIPGMLPRMPHEPELTDMAEILEQTIDVCRRAQTDDTVIYPPAEGQNDLYLVREALNKGGNLSWHDRYREITYRKTTFRPAVPSSLLDTVISLPKAPSVLQTDLRMLPFPVQPPGKPGYFSFTVLLTNKKTGVVEGYEMLTPFPDYTTMFSSFPSTLLNFLPKLGFRPRCIEVSNPELYALIRGPLQKCDIRIVLADQVESANEAFDSMVGYMKQTGQ